MILALAGRKRSCSNAAISSGYWRDSPSLRPTIPTVIDKELGRARRIAALALAGFGEQARTDPGGLRYTAEQVLGDWFPDDA